LAFSSCKLVKASDCTAPPLGRGAGIPPKLGTKDGNTRLVPNQTSGTPGPLDGQTNMCNDLVGGSCRSRCSGARGIGVTKEASCSSTAGKACAGQMCFKDPSCKNGGLGCNAAGMGECRFCGFGAYAGIECPVQSDFEVHH